MTELKLPEINRVLISGRLTRDPDRRYASDATAITSFGVAFQRHYRGHDGKLADHTGYVTIVTYQRLAEVCAEYLHRGSAVLVEGRLQWREWAGPNGERRTKLEVRGEMVHFLEKRGEHQGASSPGESPSAEGELF